MTEEPHVIYYPEKEESFVEICRCCLIDPRERHMVCKLDRRDLEDRYLRIFDEVMALKKLSNNQEDKIKKLTTKLMRVSANPRFCIEAASEKDNISVLEAENAKLRDKLFVLRNQLLTRRAYSAKSPPRSRKVQLSATPTLKTCRSASSRWKASSCHCLSHPGNDDPEFGDSSAKIQEIESGKRTPEKTQMAEQIQKMEFQLNSKPADRSTPNNDYAKVYQQLKEQTEKFSDIESANEILRNQVCQYKKQLEECLESNRQMTAALQLERAENSDLNERATKSLDVELTTRDKDERIRDLLSEVKILQAHNEELVELSSKFAKVEQENAELKRKLNDQSIEHQSLKNSYENEKTNYMALKVANEQLLAKLHELQRNIDVMTIRLMIQNEKRGPSRSSKRTRKKSHSKTRVEDPKIATADTTDDNLSESLTRTRNTIIIPSVGKQEHPSHLFEEKAIQTTTDHAINEMTQTDEKVTEIEVENVDQNDDEDLIAVEKEEEDKTLAPEATLTRPSSPQQKMNGSAGGNLSRERMLKLLEQAQISAPLESQTANSARLRGKSNIDTLLYGD